MADEVRYVEERLPDASTSALENAVHALATQVNSLGHEVTNVQQLVDTVQSRFTEFVQEFRNYVAKDLKDRRLHEALQEKIALQQELETKFGRHQKVRAYVTGILQAVDTGLVKKETLADCTEELMIAVPHYWLAPALVALAAWIGDNRELAEKAIREAINRDDEKTSLLFALICRRISRNQPLTVWLQRYLAAQDPMNIERKLVVVLDAYANGLFGADSKGIVAQKLGEWIAEMEDTVGFREAQVERWEKAIMDKVSTDGHDQEFPYLARYATNMAEISRSLNNAGLHQVMHDYVRSVFEQDMGSTAELKKQLDDLLDSLISNYDSEELPVRMRFHFEELVIQAGGDENEANRHFQATRSSFDERSDLTMLLTNAAMNPELVHASPATQMLSMSVSKDWMIEAYNNVTLKNRMETVGEIHFDIEGFECSSTDGKNEAQMQADLEQHFTRIRDNNLAQVKQSTMDYFIAGAAVLVFILSLTGMFPWYIGLLALAGGAVKFYLGMKKVKSDKEKLTADYANIIENGKKIIQALCAEITDLRRTLAGLEEQYQPLMDYLNDIAPEQFVKNGTQRTISMI